MANKGKIKLIESQYGKSLPDVLVSFYQQYGSQSLVAEALDVSRSSVSTWLKIYRLREHTVLVKADSQAVQS